MAQIKPQLSPPQQAFERKVSISRLAMFVESMWPRLWLVIGIVALFLTVSLAGLWGMLGEAAHTAVLAAFGLALLAALVFVARAPWPSRHVAIRRMEKGSGLPHRPATSYEDTLSLNEDDPDDRRYVARP